MSDPESSEQKQPDDIAEQFSAYLAEVAETAARDDEAQADHEFLEYQRLLHLAERRTLGILPRYGFNVSVPEDRSLEDVSMEGAQVMEDLDMRFRALTARHMAGLVGDAEMDNAHAEYAASYRGMMREADVYYYAGRMAGCLAVYRSGIEVDEAALDYEVSDLIAHISVNEFFDAAHKRQMLQVVQELFGDDTYAAAHALVAAEGLDVQVSSQEILHAAAASEASEELNDVMAVLVLRLGAGIVRHDDWLGLATGLQAAQSMRRRIADQVDPSDPGNQESLDLLITQLHQRVSRMGVEPQALEKLLVELNIRPHQ